MKTASFRGAKFEVEESADELPNARHVIHEFPGRKAAFAEPLGTFPARFTLDAHLIGPGYEGRLAALEKALAEPGSGKLVHPFKGEQLVAVEGQGRVSRSTREGGMARITINFVVTGEDSPGLDIDTARSLIEAGDDALDSLNGARIDVSGLQFLQSSARAILAGPRSVTNALRRINAQVQATIGIIDEVSLAIDDFVAEVDTLLNTPQTLAIKLKGLINSVMGALGLVGFDNDGGRRARSVSAAVATLALFGDTQPAVPGSTPSRNRQRQNQHDLIDLVEVSGLVEGVRVLADLPLADPSQAGVILASLNDAFDHIQGRESIDDDASHKLRRLRAQTHLHFRRRATELVEMGSFTPVITRPALCIAWDLYGDATRAEEIVQRNAIEHPLFLHGGVALAVANA